MRYDKRNIGCWISGAEGVAAATVKMQEMLSGLTGSPTAPSAPVAGTTDAQRQAYLDAATVCLQAHTDGATWVWVCGDLILEL